MNLRISVPSKSFLIGEYGVLAEGAALVVNSSPRFELVVEAGQPEELFHADSPSGRLLRDSRDRLSNLKLTFVDPYNGLGGFGRSSAEFALLYSLVNDLRVFGQTELEDLLRAFRLYAGRAGEVTPSGYDVVAQVMGGVSLIEAKRNVFEVLEWPFDELGFVIFRTGSKVATHSHLRELGARDFVHFSRISEHAIQAFRTSNSQRFLEAVSLFKKALGSEGLVQTETVKILTEVELLPGVVCGKGCGALGADAVVLFVWSDQRESVKAHLSKKYEVIADETQIAPGLEWSGQVNSPKEFGEIGFGF